MLNQSKSFWHLPLDWGRGGLVIALPEKSLSFKLEARVNSGNPGAIQKVLESFVGSNGSVKRAEDEKGGYLVEGRITGSSAKELNRQLLSALRKVEKKTTLRAEWTSGDETERYFDYVLKKKERKKT